MPHDLVFFPDYRMANPYQTMLYQGLGRLHPRPGAIDDAIRLLDQASPGQQIIFHLHWEDVLHRHLSDPQVATRGISEFLAHLEDFTDRGGTFIWTVHNHRSHIAAHPDLDRTLRAKLARLADRVHVHSLSAARAIRAECDVPFAKLVVLPHGNYLPVHDPRGIDHTAARAAQGWTEDEIVILLFGRIDGYKGAEDLIGAFWGAPPKLRLVVAGKQIAVLEPRIDTMPKTVRERVEFRPKFVPQADVASLVGAADFVALPYRSIMTSGTLLLALTLGRPVLAPDLPAIREVVTDGQEAILYPAGSTEALAAALVRLADLDAATRQSMAERAEATGALYDWTWIGRQFGAVLVEATDHGRANRRPLRLNGPAAIPG